MTKAFSPKEGGRKLSVYRFNTVVMILTIIGAFVVGVNFSGDNIIAILALLTTNGVAFFGANYGVHRAKNGKSKSEV
jgi:hypothetical protein